MLRALAIRTMGCIRVDRITEYLCDPLEKCLKVRNCSLESLLLRTTGAQALSALILQDTDPYVRKTAAICVAKLHDINPDLAQDRGFLDMLRDMTSDANPMVVSNAVAALSEIHNVSGDQVLTFSKATSSYLISAMEQCTEWGQVRHKCPLCLMHPTAWRGGQVSHGVAQDGGRGAAHARLPSSGHPRSSAPPSRKHNRQSARVQVYLLECLAKQGVDAGEATEVLLTRVASRLQHANAPWCSRRRQGGALRISTTSTAPSARDELPPQARRAARHAALAAARGALRSLPMHAAALSQRPEARSARGALPSCSRCL